MLEHDGYKQRNMSDERYLEHLMPWVSHPGENKWLFFGSIVSRTSLIGFPPKYFDNFLSSASKVGLYARAAAIAYVTISYAHAESRRTLCEANQ